MNEIADTIDVGPCSACGRQNAADARFCAGCGHPLTDGVPGAPPPVADPLIGRVIADRYRITGLLGRGGMGVVYKAEHVHIGKLTAVKLLHGELARDRDVLKRFRREAEAASKLSHPNSVQIFDFGRSQGLMFLVMEYVAGRDLGQVIHAEGTLSFARAARICAQICASVDEAHAVGIIHRDLKPENVMVTEAGEQRDFVKVLDFGLAKLREEGSGQVTVTKQGHIVGTPYYMSPEQIRGEEVDERTDIYAIGSILYKACTGVPPFSAPSPMGVLTKHLTEDLIPPSSRAPAALPREADLVVTRAMAKERERRYRTAGELRQALVDYLARSGEDPGPAAISGSASGTIGPRRAPSVAPATAATRGDVDAYERRLMRRGRVGWILAAAMLLGGVGAGAVFLYRSRDILPSTPSVESEPNNQPAEANRLPPDTRLRASLGARIDEARGDVDLFRLEGLDGSRQVIRVDVSPLPHVDLIVSLFRAGVGTPVLSVDSGGEGEGEQIPNFPVVTDRYYVQVRERWVAGERPTESISDTYRVEWGFVDLAAGDEREVNDSLELANPIDPGGERRGFIGWKGDVDHFCLSADSSPVRAVLEPVPNVDLVLRLVHRGDVRSFKVDEGGVGQGERSEAIEDATARYTCFEVSAAGEGSNADVMYRLQLPLATDAAKGPPR